MKISFSWKWFFTSVLLPIIIVVFLFLKDLNRYLSEKNYVFILLFLVLLILVLVNIYKYFIDCFIKIDKDNLIITRNFLDFKRKVNLKEIEYIYTENRWLVISVNGKEAKIRRDFIKTSQIQTFYNELSSRTKLEIKDHDSH